MAENLTSSERIKELWVLLNHNQRRFVVEMTQCSTKKEAAEVVGIDPRTVYNWPSIVDEAVDLLLADARTAAVEMLTQALTRAVMIKIAGLDSGDEKIRQAAASEIIDRGLGKATQHLEHSGDAATFRVVYEDEEGD
jgi:vacuolar-type H+-ATPase subunit H